MTSFKPQELANTVWAYVTAGSGCRRSVRGGAEAAVRGGLAGFNAQALANTVWAYATVGVAAGALYAAVAEAAVRGGLAGFNPQDLSNTAWAYATAGVAADALYAVVAERRRCAAGWLASTLRSCPTRCGRMRRRIGVSLSFC